LLAVPFVQPSHITPTARRKPNQTQRGPPTPPTCAPLPRAAFDGKHPCRIPRGGAIRFLTSLCPVPLINKGSMDSDWYQGITQKLKW